MKWNVHTGHTLDVLSTLAPGIVQTVITSPPYYGLRDYGDPGQDWPEVTFAPMPGLPSMTIPAQTIPLGMEDDLWSFVGHIVTVFREVRRVMRDDGTLWLNFGDSYAVTKQNRSQEWIDRTGGNMGMNGLNGRTHERAEIPDGIKPKDLCGIPWRIAFALQADGWFLRSDIIWHKPNPMPESVTDRPTKAHEYLFLLTKGRRYYYDHDAIKEPSTTGDPRKPYGSDGAWEIDGRDKHDRGAGSARDTDPSMRNVRSVWTMATRASPDGAHFAVFPPDLPLRCVKAGSSDRGCCDVCGSPWVRQVERTAMEIKPSPKRERWQEQGDPRANTQAGGTVTKAASSKTLGWAASCECEAGRVPCIVMDPFSGSGTTGLIATRQRRRYIGIEQSEEYADESRRTIEHDAPLFNR